MKFLIVLVGHKFEYLRVMVQILHELFQSNWDIPIKEQKHQFFDGDFNFVSGLQKMNLLVYWGTLYFLELDDIVNIQHFLTRNCLFFVVFLNLDQFLFHLTSVLFD